MLFLLVGGGTFDGVGTFGDAEGFEGAGIFDGVEALEDGVIGLVVRAV